MKTENFTLSYAPRFLRTILPMSILLGSVVCSGQVKVSETSVMIPTYVKGDPNPMPRYYEGGAHQGVQRRLYPYPADIEFTNNKEDRSYNVILVENEFLDI